MCENNMEMNHVKSQRTLGSWGSARASSIVWFLKCFFFFIRDLKPKLILSELSCLLNTSSSFHFFDLLFTLHFRILLFLLFVCKYLAFTFFPLFQKLCICGIAEVVFRKRNLLKESIHFPDAYITLDYPSEIQDETAVLIKAMLKAQANGTQAKVIGRTLKIGSASYTSKNVPKELLE